MKNIHLLVVGVTLGLINMGFTLASQQYVLLILFTLLSYYFFTRIEKQVVIKE